MSKKTTETDFQERVNLARVNHEQSTAVADRQKRLAQQKQEADFKKAEVKERRRKEANILFLSEPKVKEKNRAIIKSIIKSPVLIEAVNVLLTTSDNASKRYKLGSRELISNRHMSPYTTANAEEQTLIISVHTGVEMFKKTGNARGYYDSWGLVFTHSFKTNKLTIRISGELKEYDSLDLFLNYLATEVVKIESEEPVIKSVVADTEDLDSVNSGAVQTVLSWLGR